MQVSSFVVKYLKCHWQGILSHPEDDKVYQEQVMTKYWSVSFLTAKFDDELNL